MNKEKAPLKQDIAIIGMAGKFPMSNGIDEFWENMVQGRDCISRRSAAETDDTIKYAYGAISDPFMFDNAFFKINSIEAEAMSPQERLLLEISFQALEDAGCVPDKFSGKIGIVCGAPENEYHNKIMIATQSTDDFEHIQFSDSSLVTRVAYKLNLTGPCIYLLTACATSLTAVHVACKILSEREADVVLAGGANVYPNQDAYGIVEGLLSSDGVVRAFDKKGSGTVPSNGVAMIALKRLEDAIQEGDHIYAIIKGSAIGNDGNRKIGFTAPSLLGQIEVLDGALQASGISPEEIDFIETHGTATPLGDAVELSALKKIYNNVQVRNPITLGALKSNFGHLNMTAGIAGIIKAALILKHGIIPPGINIEKPNEELESTEIFQINRNLTKLNKEGRKLHAAVSSFGMGGVNAHVILEEYREEEAKLEEKAWILPISANSKTSLTSNAKKLEKWIRDQSMSLESASYTLTQFRKNFQNRMYLIVSNNRTIAYESPINSLKNTTKNRRNITFMFPGMGTGYDKMGQDLYRNFPIFAKYFKQCRDIIFRISECKIDILASVDSEDLALCIVSVSYSIAKSLEELGIRPNTLIGHSLGEYSMAIFNGIFSLEDGLNLVYIRNELLKSVESGKMIAVMGDLGEIQSILRSNTEIAIFNTKERFTISCLDRDYKEIVSRLEENEIAYKILKVSKPFHTKYIRKIENQYLNILKQVNCNNICRYNMVSTYYGTYIENNEMSSPEYWINQMCGMVNFYQGIETIFKRNRNIEYDLYIEIGGNNNLSSLLNSMHKEEIFSISALRSVRALREEWISFLELLGELWIRGECIDFDIIYSPSSKKKVNLPLYTFDKYYFNTLEKYYVKKSNINIKCADWESFIKLDCDMVKNRKIKLIQDYNGLNELFNQLCVYAAGKYFTCNKIESNCIYDKRKLAKELGVISNFIPFYEFLLKILEKGKLVCLKDDNKIQFDKKIYELSDDSYIYRAKERFPEFSAYIDLLYHCATNYDEVFKGKKEGNEIIYPEGSFQMLSDVYSQVPDVSMKDLYRDEVVEVICRMVESTNSTIKILEIGAGTGRLTWPLMERLKDKKVEYWFTDIGRSFVKEGEKYAHNRGIHNMKFEVFNLEQNAWDTALSEKEFDIIVGLDVIQATSNILFVLKNLMMLLKPLGWIVMVQSFWIHDIEQMIYGYSPGWWNYCKDPLRKGELFVFDEDGWKKTFEDAGLYKVHTLSGGVDRIKKESGIVLGMKEGRELLRGKNILEGPNTVTRYESENVINQRKNDSNNNQTEIDLKATGEELISDKVLDIIYDTIGKQEISPLTSLSEIGIDSLSILIIRTKIKKIFGCSLMVKDFYECKNIKELVNKIESLTNDRTESTNGAHGGTKRIKNLFEQIKDK